jgi:hypothetical protein
MAAATGTALLPAAASAVNTSPIPRDTSTRLDRLPLLEQRVVVRG